MRAARSGPVVLIVLIVLLTLAAPLGARPLAAGTPPALHAYAGAGMIVINADAAWTTKRAVTLKLNASSMGGAVTKMRFSVDRSSWSAWESYAKTRAYTLPAGDAVAKPVWVQFENSAGDRRIDDDTIGLDTVAPDTVDDSDPQLHDAAVTVTLTAADATSGVAAVSYRLDGGSWQSGSSFTVPAPAGTVRAYAVDYFATDIAGNAESPHSCTVKIDTVHDVTVPVTTSSADDAWHNSDVRVTFAVSGPGQPFTTRYRLDGGPWQTGLSFTVPAPGDHSNDGVHALEYYTTNAWDNVEDVNAATVRIDTEPPMTGDDAPAEWSQDDVVLTFSPRDTLSSTVTRYRLDGGPWQEGTVLMVPANADKTNDGIHTVDYYSTDAAGNAEIAHACQVKINVPAIARDLTAAGTSPPLWAVPYVMAADAGVVVWMDGRKHAYSGDYDLYGLDLPSGNEVAISTGPSTPWNPAISGDTVVWEDDRTGTGDIYGYDLSSHTEFPICTAPGEQSYPAISGNTVVWTDQRGGNRDIYGYDLSTHTEFPICAAPSDQSTAAISGSTVVWIDTRNGQADVYGYDLSTHTEFPICSAPFDQWEPGVSGSTVVWIDTRNGQADVYGYDLSTHTEFPVCTGAWGKSMPAVSGSTVAWTDWRGGGFSPAVYGYDLSTKVEFPICTDASIAGGWMTVTGDSVFMSRGRSIWRQDLQSGVAEPVCGEAWGNRQKEPAVSEEVIVWTDESGADADIHGLNRETGAHVLICTAPGEQSRAATSGDVIVWQDRRDGGNDIYGSRLASMTEFPVCRARGEQTHPDVSGSIVVWQDDRGGDGGDIYGFDLSTATEFPICTRKGRQLDPTISGNRVVWFDESLWTFYVYDVETKQETRLFSISMPAGYVSDLTPDLAGTTLVYNDRGAITAYDLTLDMSYPVATVDRATRVVTDGELICWQDAKGLEVYNVKTDSIMLVKGSSDASGATSPPATCAGTVVWANNGVHGATLTYPQWTTELEILPEGGATSAPTLAKLPAFAAGAAPPAAKAAGAAPARWIRTRAVRLALTASSDQGEIAEMALSDGGVTYGAWEPYAESRPFTLSAGDGVKTVAVVFRDSAGLVSPVASAVIGVDTKRPATTAWAATATRGRKAALKYRVSDAASKLVWHTVQIKVKDARGKVVKKVTLKKQPTAQTRTWKFTCTLARGSYRYYVYATDAAGNVQSRVGSATLVVR